MSKIVKGIFILGVIASLIILPVTRVKPALINIKNYIVTRKEVKSLNDSLNSIDGQLASERKKINESVIDTVDLESPKEIYNFINEMDSTKSLTASVVSINNGVVKVADSGEYKPEDSDENIDGLRIVVVADDSNTFLKEFSELQIPVETIHVAPLENTIVLVFNTKGGY